MAMAAERNGPSLEQFGVPWPELNDGLVYTDTVEPTNCDRTLIEFYSSKHNNSAPLEGVGAKLLYCRLPWKEPDAPHLLGVLYEDDDIVAINKPSGLQVLPGGFFQQRTVLTQLRWRTFGPILLPVLSGIASTKGTHPVPVHRLGRGTSGILLCAKTMFAKAQLAAYFADGTSVITCNRHTKSEFDASRRISKIYRALATGILERDEIMVDQPIGMMRYPGVARGLYVASSSGKPAVSKVKVLERDVHSNCTLVQVEIHTGRPHQIRIHLSFIGHPLVGDPLYAMDGRPKQFESESRDENVAEDGGYQRPTKPVPGDCGYQLHAHQLVLFHPTTKEVIHITAPLPPILQSREEHAQSDHQN